MDQKKTNDKKTTVAPAEIHESAEEARKAEEIARKERIKDKQAEQNAHHEANIIKQVLENIENKKDD